MTNKNDVCSQSIKKTYKFSYQMIPKCLTVGVFSFISGQTVFFSSNVKYQLT